MVSTNMDHNSTAIYCLDSNPNECFNTTCEYIELYSKGNKNKAEIEIDAL